MKRWQWLFIGLLIGLSFAIAAHASAPKQNIPGNNSIQENVIIKTNPPSEPKITKPKISTSIRNQTEISEETIRLYLETKQSPLAPYSAQIAASPFSGTILGICTIEQYGCAKAPAFSPYNFWGIMRVGGGLARYGSYEEGIEAIDKWLATHEAKHSTIESLNGYYVVPASANWYNTVLRVKKLLENN